RRVEPIDAGLPQRAGRVRASASPPRTRRRARAAAQLALLRRLPCRRGGAGAFDCATLAVAVTDGLFDLQLRQKGMLRSLRSAEFSDGTLRFLLWAAALLSPQPPS